MYAGQKKGRKQIMNNEYRYLLLLGFWIVLWTFAPFIALPLFIIVTVRHFRAIRQQRQAQAVAVNIDRQRWAQMEGFNEQEPDPADWWKRS